MKSEDEIKREFETVRGERIGWIGDEPDYDKGFVDGLHTALQWVLSEEA